MRNRRNYYRILHVQPDAPREIIRASYRTLMQKLKQHPDLGGDNWNASILNEAYSTLTNSEKREAYDQQFLHKLKNMSAPTAREKQGEEKQRQQNSENKRYYKNDNSRCPFCGTPKPARFRYSHLSDCSHCHSPLKPVNRLRLAEKSQRGLQRTSHHVPLRYFTAPGDRTGRPGTSRDLSTNGMQISTTRRLEENQIIKIVSNVISAVARVTYCQQYKGRKKYAVGMEFLTLHFHKSTGTFISNKA